MRSTEDQPTSKKLKVSAASDKPLIVAVIGYTGGVGKCLLAAMDKIGLKPFALVRSTSMRIGYRVETDVNVDYHELASCLIKEANRQGGVAVMADVTASSDLQTTYYKSWLDQGISVCTANKGIFAGPEKDYMDLLSSVSPSVKLLHEATVGAGLPVLGTLSNLKASSHEILKVEGVLSGTLAYVLGAVAGGKKTLSQAVLEAKDLGYTEPDPRLDLSGMDVARKAVILARLSGLTGIELTSLDIESMVPESLKDCSVEDFLTGLPAFDDAFAARVKEVESSPGRRLHYAAKIDLVEQKVTVGPFPAEAGHPFNNAGPDNLISITTNFYNPRPLVIQGAGAGGDVTATGVLVDILHCK